MAFFGGILGKKGKEEPVKTETKKEEPYSKSLFEANKRLEIMNLESDLAVANRIEGNGGIATFTSEQLERWIEEIESFQTPDELERFKANKKKLEEEQRQKERELEIPKRMLLRKLEDELAVTKRIEKNGGLSVFSSAQIEAWIKEVERIRTPETLNAFERKKKQLEEEQNTKYREVEGPKQQIISDLERRLERSRAIASKGGTPIFSIEQVETWLNEARLISTKADLERFESSKKSIEENIERQEREFTRPKKELLDNLQKDLKSTSNYEKSGGKLLFSSSQIEKWIEEAEKITSIDALQTFITKYKNDSKQASEYYKKIEMPKNEIIRNLQQDLRTAKRMEANNGVPIFSSSQLEMWIEEVSSYTSQEQIINFNNELRRQKDERKKYDREVTVPKNMLILKFEEELSIALEAEKVGGVYSFGSSKFSEWLEKVKNITTKEELDEFKEMLSTAQKEKTKLEQVALERNIILASINLDLQAAEALKDSHPYFAWEFENLTKLFFKVQSASTSKELLEANKNVINFKKNQLGSPDFDKERLKRFNINNENLSELAIRLMELKMVKKTMIEWNESGLSEQIEEDKKAK